ncbi:MAG: ABC transporter substrate-binding protein [Anaerolineae bacterium]|nr:ABC transporter substrate-binding protein [Anaerolineae bacterium]
MNKRLLVLLVLVATFALMLAPASAQDTKIVTFLTTFGGSELDALRVSLDAFTEATGILVTVESNRDSTAVLRTRVAAGSPPDVALIPRPGLLAEFARAGNLVALVNADGTAGLIDPAVLTDNYAQGIIDLGNVDGAVYGILAKANSKSTIWYKPASFAELDVEVPTTWDELLAIQAAYVAAGKTPWSIGGADGWTLTDWFENIYVRLNGPEKYTQLFVTHEIPWTDDSVVQTLEAFKMIVSPADTNLAGGAEGTLSTGFIEAANIVFRPDAGAEMYYEGGFMGGIIAGNFPDLTPIDDFNAFLFPAANEEWGAPVVGGGDLLAAFADRPEVAELVNWMAGSEGNTLWAGTGAIVSPNKNVGLDVYSPLAALDAEQVANASTFVFDGSDLAPSVVGGDAMFIGLQDFINNPDDMMTILQQIEDVAAGAY